MIYARIKVRSFDFSKCHSLVTILFSSKKLLHFCARYWHHFYPGANPTTALYNAMSRLVRFEIENIFFYIL
jgi:hypothetical protein